MKKSKVLFICVRNSARSQMAAALLNEICSAQFEVHSAGLESGTVSPLAIEVMREVGIDISCNKTQTVFDAWKSSKVFKHVIKVCSEAEAENRGCPIFPGTTQVLSWPFPDPLDFQGTEGAKLEQTRLVRDAIKKKIEQWCEEVCPQALAS
jgi:arsenate reductase